MIFYDIFCDLVAGPQLKPTDVIASFAVDSTPVIIRALLRAKNGEGALDLDGSDEDVSCAKPALSTIKDASLAKPALSAIENAPLAKPAPSAIEDGFGSDRSGVEKQNQVKGGSPFSNANGQVINPDSDVSNEDLRQGVE